jgi:hypothetical protein
LNSSSSPPAGFGKGSFHNLLSVVALEKSEKQINGWRCNNMRKTF